MTSGLVLFFCDVERDTLETDIWQNQGNMEADASFEREAVNHAYDEPLLLLWGKQNSPDRSVFLQRAKTQ